MKLREITCRSSRGSADGGPHDPVSRRRFEFLHARLQQQRRRGEEMRDTARALAPAGARPRVHEIQDRRADAGRLAPTSNDPPDCALLRGGGESSKTSRVGGACRIPRGQSSTRAGRSARSCPAVRRRGPLEMMRAVGGRAPAVRVQPGRRHRGPASPAVIIAVRSFARPRALRPRFPFEPARSRGSLKEAALSPG